MDLKPPPTILYLMELSDRGSGMIESFLNVIFGCSHQRTTFPQTPVRKATGYIASGAARHGAYVVCLDCGKEFDYDWSGMRVGEAVNRPVTAAAEESFSMVHR